MVVLIKKYWLYVVGVLLILLLAFNCVNNSISELTGEGNVYEKQLERRVKALKIKEVEYIKLSDSLSKDNKAKDSAISVLKKKNSAISTKLAENESKNKAEIKKVKSFTYKQSSEAIAKAYNAPKSVSYTNTGVVLNDSIPNKVVETIVEKEHLETKVVLTEAKLSNVIQESTVLEEKVKNKDLQISEAAELGAEKDEALKLSEDFNKSMKKENRRLKTGRFIDKLLIVSAFVGGILIGR